MNKPKLIVMVGNIASGKSTWIRNFLDTYLPGERKNWVVLSKDDLRRMLGAGKYFWNEDVEPIIQECLIDMLCNFMKAGINIILDETNMEIETRNAYLDLTKERVSFGYDYETIAVIMSSISYEKMTRRIGYREGKPEWGKENAKYWEQIWKRKNDKFEMLTKEEGFDEIWEIK